MTGMKTSPFMASTKTGITTAMQKACYLVVLDLHTTDKKEVIQLFKDWTDYSSKLVEGELVKKRWLQCPLTSEQIQVKQWDSTPIA